MSRSAFNEAESLLAVHLQELGLHFKQGYRYVPGRKFEADFAVWYPLPQPPAHTSTTSFTLYEGHIQVDPEPRHGARFALIEVQGGIFRKGKPCRVCGRTDKGAHGSVTGIKRDNERLYWAFRSGWSVLRFTPDQVKDGTAKAMIEAALKGEP